jgi:hypothetical protein
MSKFSRSERDTLYEVYCDSLDINASEITDDAKKYMHKVINVIEDMILNISKHKVEYAISNNIASGLRDTIRQYGIIYNKAVHDVLVEAVQLVLEGEYIEREWSENEYNNFVMWKPEYER